MEQGHGGQRGADIAKGRYAIRVGGDLVVVGLFSTLALSFGSDQRQCVGDFAVSGALAFKTRDEFDENFVLVQGGSFDSARVVIGASTEAFGGKLLVASEAFYIGALGSTRTHGKRVAQLREAGLSDEVIARIHGPVGADIGAVSPAEIAVSIMAEMTERLRRPETRPGTSQ